MQNSNGHPKFNLGQVVITRGALAAIEMTQDDPKSFLRRHQRGHWGELCPDDRQMNDDAVAHEGDIERQDRVLSAYRLADASKVWVVTERDRSVTTILLPSEY